MAPMDLVPVRAHARQHAVVIGVQWLAVDALTGRLCTVFDLARRLQSFVLRTLVLRTLLPVIVIALAVIVIVDPHKAEEDSDDIPQCQTTTFPQLNTKTRHMELRIKAKCCIQLWTMPYALRPMPTDLGLTLRKRSVRGKHVCIKCIAGELHSLVVCQTLVIAIRNDEPPGETHAMETFKAPQLAST